MSTRRHPHRPASAATHRTSYRSGSASQLNGAGSTATHAPSGSPDQLAAVADGGGDLGGHVRETTGVGDASTT